MLSIPAADVMSNLGTEDSQLATLVTTIYGCGSLLGSVFIAPSYMVYGHRKVFLLYAILFPVANVCCAFSKNAGMLISFRFLSGCVSVLPYFLGSVSATEIFGPSGTPASTGLLSLSSFLGGPMGLISGCFLDTALTWQWIFRIIATASGSIGIIGALSLRESHVPIILATRRDFLRQEPRHWDLDANEKPMTWAFLVQEIYKSHRMCLKSPKLVIVASFLGTMEVSKLLCYTTVGSVFGKQYGVTGHRVGLVSLGVVIGEVFGVLSFVLHNVQITSRRMTMAAIFSILLVISGFVIYGWTAQYQTHEAVPAFGTALILIGSRTSVSIPRLLPLALYILPSYGRATQSNLRMSVFSLLICMMQYTLQQYQYHTSAQTAL